MTLLPATLSPLWLVGCGNMAGAMLTRWLAAGLDPALVTVIRPSGVAPAAGIRTLTALPLDETPGAVLLGVKPQKLAEVAPALATVTGPQTILISILAGTTTTTLGGLFPRVRAVVRAMPNTPVAIGRGVVALHAPDAVREPVAALMAPLGLVEWVDDEAGFDLITALAGSGPAFLFRFVDALARAASDLGLDPGQAARMALATVDGAARLATGSDESPATLADRVASPGGSTRSGLALLDEDDALADLLRRTLAASEARNRELARS